MARKQTPSTHTPAPEEVPVDILMLWFDPRAGGALQETVRVNVDPQSLGLTTDRGRAAVIGGLTKLVARSWETQPPAGGERPEAGEGLKRQVRSIKDVLDGVRELPIVPPAGTARLVRHFVRHLSPESQEFTTITLAGHHPKKVEIELLAAVVAIIAGKTLIATTDPLAHAHAHTGDAGAHGNTHEAADPSHAGARTREREEIQRVINVLRHMIEARLEDRRRANPVNWFEKLERAVMDLINERDELALELHTAKATAGAMRRMHEESSKRLAEYLDGAIPPDGREEIARLNTNAEDMEAEIVAQVAEAGRLRGEIADLTDREAAMAAAAEEHKAEAERAWNTANRAIKTLQSHDFTDTGGEEWAAPTERPPHTDAAIVIERARAEIEQVAAIMESRLAVVKDSLMEAREAVDPEFDEVEHDDATRPTPLPETNGEAVMRATASWEDVPRSPWAFGSDTLFAGVDLAKGTNRTAFARFERPEAEKRASMALLLAEALRSAYSVPFNVDKSAEEVVAAMERWLDARGQ